jgi:hypothetical protein
MIYGGTHRLASRDQISGSEKIAQLRIEEGHADPLSARITASLNGAFNLGFRK